MRSAHHASVHHELKSGHDFVYGTFSGLCLDSHFSLRGASARVTLEKTHSPFATQVGRVCGVETSFTRKLRRTRAKSRRIKNSRPTFFGSGNEEDEPQSSQSSAVGGQRMGKSFDRKGITEDGIAEDWKLYLPRCRQSWGTRPANSSPQEYSIAPGLIPAIRQADAGFVHVAIIARTITNTGG